MAQEQSVDKITATWLLPAIPPIVAANTGGHLCTVIPQNSVALHYTLISSYALWGIGVPLALSILVLYIHRLIVYKAFPPNQYQTYYSFLLMTSVSVHSWQLDPLVKAELELFNLV